MVGVDKNRIIGEQSSSSRAFGSSGSRPSGYGSSTSSSASNVTSSSGGSVRSSAPPGYTSSSQAARGNGVGMRSDRGGYDGNRDPEPTTERDPNRSRPTVEPKNFDLPVQGWQITRGNDIVTSLPTRPAASKLGSAVKIGLNTYNVVDYPKVAVYQYDVNIGNGIEKRGVINKVWNSKAVQAALGGPFIFDGNKLAWSGKSVDREIRLTVDLDADQGRTPRAGKEADVHRIMIRQTNKVRFDTLQAHLAGKCAFDNRCLEAINFFDHLLRMTPSSKYTSIKRSFFQQGEKRFDLGNGVEAMKGVFASLRIVHPGKLSINLDVANGTFWTCQHLPMAATLLCKERSTSDLSVSLSKAKGGEKGRAGKELKKLRKTHVQARHRGKDTVDDYVIERFVYQSAKTTKFMAFDKATGKEYETSIYDYYAKTYNIRLQFPDLPLVKMTRGKNTLLPMEVLTLKQNQRYQYKMSESQTSNMIKFAVTAPPDRYKAIEHGLKMLSWGTDPVLQKYGLKIDDNKTMADARLLLAPTVKFGAGDAKPGTSGRWDLKGKKFLETNKAPLKSWAVCVIPGRRGGKPDKTVVEQFIAAFVSGYVAHGGKVENKQPAFSLAQTDDVGAWVTATWNAAGNQSQMRPQILFFILPDKDANVYGRIKRSCECRYGVVSQCIQYSHAQKKQPQYISNVCMKFNAKLGGVTCRAIGKTTGGPTGAFKVPTMVIGADVSHSAPGVQNPSMAAVTISMDKLATRYATVCQTNGYRVEMIQTDTIENDLKPVIQHWISNVGGGKVPATIMYLRDGVSEGQYIHVLQQEVADLKSLIKKADPASNTKFIVVVGSKRHHVRFFPEKGDRNGNAHPGTLVETGVTNPYENDFYLQAHAAIKGTARPMHYHVLLNEPNMSNDELITLLYEQSYQYIRATTPISQHPAIYYAHLASNRAIPHDPKWAGSSDGVPSGSTSKMAPASGSQGKSAGKTGTGSSSGIPTDFDKLMAMPNQGSINTSMWYI